MKSDLLAMNFMVKLTIDATFVRVHYLYYAVFFFVIIA